MFPAPCKPCEQAKLSLEDFPCVYTTGPNWTRQISPGAGLTLQYDLRRACDRPPNTLLRGVTLRKWQEDGLLLACLLTATCWGTFLKRHGPFLGCRLLDPHHPCLGEEGEENRRWLQWFLQKKLLFNFLFPLSEVVVTLERKQQVCFFSCAPVEDCVDMKG